MTEAELTRRLTGRFGLAPGSRLHVCSGTPKAQLRVLCAAFECFQPSGQRGPCWPARGRNVCCRLRSRNSCHLSYFLKVGHICEQCFPTS